MEQPTNNHITVLETLNNIGYCFFDTKQHNLDHHHYLTVLKAMRDYRAAETAVVADGIAIPTPIYTVVEKQNIQRVGHCEQVILLYLDYIIDHPQGRNTLYYAVFTGSSMIFFAATHRSCEDFSEQNCRNLDLDLVFSPSLIKKESVEDVLFAGLKGLADFQDAIRIFKHSKASLHG